MTEDHLKRGTPRLTKCLYSLDLRLESLDIHNPSKCNHLSGVNQKNIHNAIRASSSSSSSLFAICETHWNYMTWSSKHIQEYIEDKTVASRETMEQHFHERHPRRNQVAYQSHRNTPAIMSTASAGVESASAQWAQTWSRNPAQTCHITRQQYKARQQYKHAYVQ